MKDSKRGDPHPAIAGGAADRSDDQSLLGKFEALEMRKRSRAGRRVMSLALGLIGLAGVIMFVVNFGEVSAFADQVTKAEPLWLLLAVAAQGGTYFTQSLVWWLILRRLGSPRALGELFVLGIGKLFADQALPSAGLSGAVFIMLALTRRGTPREDAFTGFVFSSVSFFAAFVLAALASFGIVSLRDGASEILDKNLLYYLIFLGLSLIAIVLIATMRFRSARAWLARRAAVGEWAAFIRPALTRIGEEKTLFLQFVLIQLATRAIDTITLVLAFRAIGETAPLEVCFAAVSLASLAATLAPTPMGLGSFEAGLVASLSALGVSVEAALTTTLLYRGLTLWMPLALGFFIVQRELLRGRKAPKPEEAPIADAGGTQ